MHDMMVLMLSIQGLFGAFMMAAAGFSLPWMHPASPAEEVRTVRWVLAHQPTDVYENAIRVFGERLSAETEGRLKLEVLTPEDVGFRAHGDISYPETIALLDEGRAEITSVYSAAAAANDSALGIINFPYLFSDYERAARVFDSSVGAGILDSYSSATTVRALAFTYSGGYRLLVSKNPIKTPADLKGVKIAVSGGNAAESFWKELGANPVRMDLESGSADLSGITAVEATYTRLSEVLGADGTFARNILESNHSLFTTMLVASDAFLSSLSAKDQEALVRAAQAAAAVEREDSIALAERTRANALSNGSAVRVPSAELQAAFAKSSETVYKNLSATINQELLASIRKGQR